MRRVVRPEILDDLPADDPRAIHSRRDLRKINAIMRHASLVTRTLQVSPFPVRTIVELGAGDGSLLMEVASRLGNASAGVRAILIDLRPTLSERTRAGFAGAGWHVEAVTGDVFEWLEHAVAESADVILANLFLHHFEDPQLAKLLRLAATRTRQMIACEPLRSRAALAGVALMPLIGCNQVTVHDGRISVKAGFRDRELSALWPQDDRTWRLTERRAGLFTHFFAAARA